MSIQKLFQCSTNTVLKAYEKLEQDHIIYSVPKSRYYVVEDDIAADLDVNKKNDPMFSYDTSSKIIYLKSYSKVLMPGLRVAALILPNLLINKFLEYKRWTDISSPILSQGALEICIKNGMFDAHMKQLVSLYSSRINCSKNILLEYNHPNIQHNIPES